MFFPFRANCGLAIQYGNDENLSLMLRHLFALAFLLSQKIPAALDILKPTMPSEANGVVQWFEDNYVYGRIRRQPQFSDAVRDLPLFPPSFWSVYDSMALGISRTQNIVEAWHRGWKTLVGESHVCTTIIFRELN